MKTMYLILASFCLSTSTMERPPQFSHSSEETISYKSNPDTRERVALPAIPSSDGSTTATRGKRKEQAPIRSLKKQRPEESFSIAYYLKTNPQLILGRTKGSTLDLSYMSISSLDGLAAIPGIARIIHLSLAHNLIREIKREDFVGVGHLISLDLSNNLLEFLIADSFAELGSLINLFLNDNIIRTLQHDALTGLNNLKQLSLSRNRIKELDGKMLKGAFNLEELDLSKNEIALLEPHTFVSLSFLKRLKLDNNQIAQLTAQMFEGFRLKGQSFNGLRYLELLDVRHNKLTEIPTTILTRMPALSQLLLGGNRIAYVTDQNSIALKKATHLKKMDLAGNQLSDPTIKKLRQTLPNVEIIATAAVEPSQAIERLVEFSREKQIEEEKRMESASDILAAIQPIRSLATYLADNTFSFTNLIHKSIDKKWYELDHLDLASLDGLHKVPGIQDVFRIYLEKNKLKVIPARAFARLPKLEEIILNSNEITAIDPDAFQDVPHLSSVFLDSNHLSALQPKIMQQFKNIKALGLSGNQIKSLPPFIFKDLKALKELSLSRNDLKILTPEMLAGLENLERLDISANQFTQLSPGLFTPLKKLTFLNLLENPLSKENVKAIENALPEATVFF